MLGPSARCLVVRARVLVLAAVIGEQMGVEWLVDLPLPEFEAEGFEASAQLEMRALVEKSVAYAADDPSLKPAGSKKVFTANPNFGVAKNFQTGVPDDEPYRIVLMAIRRRLYKTKAVMDKLYMGEISPM